MNRIFANPFEKFFETKREFPLSGEECKVISVCAEKGGVGKTTTSVHLASGLSYFYKKRVLLIDLDQQAHIQYCLSNISNNGRRKSLSDILLQRNGNIMDIIESTSIERLYLTPSDKGLSATEEILNTKIGKEFVLRGNIKKAKEYFDFIVIDCAPNFATLTLNALLASDYCIIPCDISILSFEGLCDIFTTLETIRERLNHNINVLGILITKKDRRNQKINEEILDSLNLNYSSLLFKTVIHQSTSIVKAQIQGLPVFLSESSSRSAMDYKEFLCEVIERLRI